MSASLSKVETLNQTNRRDIPATLRVIADQIERGDNGVVDSVTLVVKGKILDICHLGEGNSDKAHLLLCLGQRKLESMVMNQIEG